MNVQQPLPYPVTPVTGDSEVDVAIAKWIRGTYANWECEMLIRSAVAQGRIPATDGEGREWSATQIMDYGIMITPNAPKIFTDPATCGYCELSVPNLDAHWNAGCGRN